MRHRRGRCGVTSSLPIDEIRRRAAALRLSTKALADLCGLSTDTIYKSMEYRRGTRRRPTKATLRKLTNGIVAEELSELKRLATLHPGYPDIRPEFPPAHLQAP